MASKIASKIRTFALLIVNDYDVETMRIPLDYVEMPRNLGFELEFTTLESRLTTYFTGAREKRTPITLNLYFLAPNAYDKANKFKAIIQANLNKRMLLEYDDTFEKKYWEGKIQKFGQDELDQFKTLICPISFLPATPKYYKRDNAIRVQRETDGKKYPYEYPYYYGDLLFTNNKIENTYFDDIPLRVTIHGKMENPTIALKDVDTEEVYSTVSFNNLVIKADEELIIDAINSKILIKKNNVFLSAYDYLSKSKNLDSFLFARANATSEVIINLKPDESGWLEASYRQYTL